MRILPIAAVVSTAALVGLALLTRPSRVVAGTALRMDVPQLVAGAELVLEGRILSATALESPDGRIETEFLLQVERTFAGADEPFRAVRIPGGVLEDGRGMLLAGMPVLRAGEDTLLFLSQEGETGVRMPVGLAQGKFSVHRLADGKKSLTQDAAGISLVNEQGVLLSGQGGTVRDYAQVVAEIEAALAARKAR